MSCSHGEGVTCVGGRVASRSECPVCRDEAAKGRQGAVVQCREDEDGGSVAREGQRQEERMASARMSVWARRARRWTSRKSPASSRDFRGSLLAACALSLCAACLGDVAWRGRERGQQPLGAQTLARRVASRRVGRKLFSRTRNAAAGTLRRRHGDWNAHLGIPA